LGLVLAEALESKTMIVSKPVGWFFDSEKWTIGNTNNEMVNACLSFLSESFLEEEQNPFTIEKTVQHYLNIYNG